MTGMKTINATEFKAKCLEILDNLPAEGIAITKRGKTVARVLPEDDYNITQFHGCLKGMEIKGDVFSTGVKWDAES
jgi:antitoxin (DNA-binding transcriptional repressor) of toxin-antitoxin stability system